MRRVPLLSLAVLAVFLVWRIAQADQMNFKADLSPGPGITSAGKGTATVRECRMRGRR